MSAWRRTALALGVSGALHAVTLIASSTWTGEPTTQARPVEPAGTSTVEWVQLESIHTVDAPARDDAQARPVSPKRAPRKKGRAVAAIRETPATPPPAPGTVEDSVADRVAAAVADAVVPSEPSGVPDETSAGVSGPVGGQGHADTIGARSSGGAPGPGGTDGAGSGDPDLLAGIHARLAEAARRCYPAAARRYRVTGEVQVSFCLDGRGGVSQVAASRSSGSALLDRAAVDCVVPGAVPLPGPTTCVSVAVQFRAQR